MTEEPTQQIRLRTENQQVTPPLPPGLDPTRGRRPGQAAEEASADPGAEPTGVLRLDELFSTEPDAERHVDRPAIEQETTWTAMPIVSVRSEPYSPPAPPPSAPVAATSPAAVNAAQPSAMPIRPTPHPTGPPVTARPSRSRQARARATHASATTARRLSTDLAAVRRHTDALMHRTDEWIHRDDNALMVLTGLIACVLIIIVAALGH